MRKLGTNEGRTKTAVRIFGEVGGEQPTDEANSNNPFIPPGGGPGPLASELDPRAPKLPIQQRRLTRMMAETALSFLESAASSVIMWTAAGVGKAWEVVSAQRVILLVLLASVVWNVVVGRGAVVSYWNEKRAARWLEEVGVAPNGIMSRAVYLRDLEEVVSNGTMSWVVEGESQWLVLHSFLSCFLSCLLSPPFPSFEVAAASRTVGLARETFPDHPRSPPSLPHGIGAAGAGAAARILTKHPH